MKKVAIYARVSTLEQAEHGYSIGEQIDKLKKYCDLKDYSIYKEYVDGGYSGAKLDRPAMQELISDAKNGKFEVVIVYKLDRLSRNLQNALYLIKDVFRENNISFVSLGENIDLSTAAGELNFNMFASFAEFERANIKDRMSMGRYARAKSGKIVSPSHTPFGYNYNDGILIKDEIEAPIVKSIFDMYLDGLSLSKILIKLNDDGYIGKSKPWPMSGIYPILRNKTYAGFIKYRDEVFKGLHDPIISPLDFDEVQRQIKIRQENSYKRTNTSRPFQSKYMLSGLLKCGKCGSRMEIIQYGKDKTIDGVVYKFRKYQCAKNQSKYKRMTGIAIDAIDERCESQKYDLKELESRVLSEIAKVKADPDVFLKLNTKKDSYSISHEYIKSEIKSIENRLSKIVDLYLDDKIDLDIYTEKKNEYDKKIDSLKKSINKKSSDSKLLDSKSFKNKILNFDVSNENYQVQSDIVKKLIEKIVVYPTKIKIYWNI